MKQFYSLFLACVLFSVSETQAACGTGQSNVTVVIVADNYPAETTWSLRDGITNALIDSGNVNGDSVCVLNNRCLRFTIFDSFGDGICCTFGSGSYTVRMNGTVVASGGNFDFSETTSFNCPAGHDCTNTLVATMDTMTAPFTDSWYTFIPDSTGMYDISTCGLNNNCDTKVYIYDHCSGLVFDESNTGTIFYDDDGCGNLQSKISAALVKNTVYYIRIGDFNTSCAGQSLNWQINFVGAITGCTDTASCNYNPLATVSDSNCIYPPSLLCSAPDLAVDGQVLESSMYMDNLTVGQTNCYISEGCLMGYGTRRLIRFDTHIRNIGNEDYYIGPPDTVGNQFVFDGCHNHWHYKGYAEYLLLNENNQPLQQGFKNGFCVLDLECSGGGTAKYGCGNMGVSVGCGDIYSAGLDCQWIDVTDVDTGIYTLVVRVNWDQSPDRLGRIEKTFSNNWAQVCFNLEYDAGNHKVFSILPNCVPYVDCAGDTFGNASLDCEGICNGSGLRGDLDISHTADSADVDLYLDEIKEETIVRTNCNDLNGDSLMTVTDAARLNGCLLSNSTAHHHPGNYQNTHKHCEFPFNVYNPFDSVTFSIADTNLIDHYIELSVYNPSCFLLAYEFKLHGLVVDSVKNLALGNYAPDIRSSSSGHIVGISLDENSLFKQMAPLNFMRVYFSALTDTQICISQIIAVVNSNYEEVNGKTGNACVRIAQHQDSVITRADLITTETLQVIPNPSSGVFELYLEGKSMHQAAIRVMDEMGRTIYQSKNDGLSNHYSLDLSSHPSGIYLLQMNVNGGSLTRRLLLAKQ